METFLKLVFLFVFNSTFYTYSMRKWEMLHAERKFLLFFLVLIVKKAT